MTATCVAGSKLANEAGVAGAPACAGVVVSVFAASFAPHAVKAAVAVAAVASRKRFIGPLARAVMEGGFERRNFTNDARLSIASATRPDNEFFASEFQRIGELEGSNYATTKL